MQTGFIVLADIAGFAADVTAAESEHARSNLGALLGAVLDSIDAPLRFAALPAAAVLIHVDTDKVASGQALLEAVERLYFVFAEARDDLAQQTDCRCPACDAIASLRLEVLLHYGNYDMEDGDARNEIGATALALLRLLAEHQSAQDGSAASCCLPTREAVEAMGLTEYFADMPRHLASDERFGEVDYNVHDLEAARRARARETADDSWKGRSLWCRKVVADLPAPPAAVWPYLADPQQRKRWVNGLSEIELENTDRGRVGVGTTLHCTHGNHVFPFTITDWQPGRQLIYHLPMPLGASVTWAQVLEPRRSGCRLTMTYTLPSAPKFLNTMLMRAITRKMGKAMYANTSASAGKLERLIEDEIDAGHIATDPPQAVDPAAIDAALADRFPPPAD